MCPQGAALVMTERLPLASLDIAADEGRNREAADRRSSLRDREQVAGSLSYHGLQSLHLFADLQPCRRAQLESSCRSFEPTLRLLAVVEMSSILCFACVDHSVLLACKSPAHVSFYA
jgi:hypothetical protein